MPYKVIIDLETVVSLYNSLIQYINDLYDCFDHYEQIGIYNLESMNTKLRENKKKSKLE